MLLVAIFTLASGCDKFFDVNDDTDLPSSATPNLLLTPIQGLMATNCYQQGETSAYFAQQIATLSGVNSVKDRWDYSSVTRVGLFRRHFHDVAGNARNLYLSAQEEGSKNFEGAGRTMMVLSTQTATDLFGQLPYKEALKGNPSPAYDEQSVIYEGMIEEIDLAISLFQDSDEETDREMKDGRSDRMFNGDMDLWESFAHGIKARILLHLTPNINQNYQEIIDEVDLALPLWKDAIYRYTDGEVNAYKLNQWGRSRSEPEWDYVDNILHESAPTSFLLESVMGYDPEEDTIKDPRQPLLMKPGQYMDSVLYYTDALIATIDTAIVKLNLDSMVLASFDTVYLSVAPSEGRNQLIEIDKYPDLYDFYMTSDYSDQPLMVVEELHFIKAEAAFKLNRLSDAYQSFQNGVQAHMNRVGVAQADINTFLASDLVPNNANDLTLSDIMMQKWLAMYLQLEAWVDMRRYQYDPKIYVGLKRPKNLAFFWEENEAGKWIQRIPYDNETEEIFNKPELDRLGAFQNPDWLKVPLWWAERN